MVIVRSAAAWAPVHPKCGRELKNPALPDDVESGPWFGVPPCTGRVSGGGWGEGMSKKNW